MSGMRPLDRLRLACVAAVVAGFVEGLVRAVTRHFPGLHPAHKLSIDVLWVAPLVNVLFFCALAVGLHVLLRFAPASLRRRDRSISLGAFVALGAIGVGLATAVLHPASVVVLGLGLGVVAARRTPEDARPEGARGLTLAGGLLVVGVLVAAVSGPLGERVRLGALADAPAGETPNVLVLMLDTVRRDELLEELDAPVAPRLAAFAREGVRFEDAWSNTSWSLPSQASVLTGLPSAEHAADWPGFSLTTRVPTLAERFASHGYASGAFSGNSSWVTPEYLGRGFLRFRAYVLEDLLRRTSLGKWGDGLARALSFYGAGRGKKAPTLHRQLWDFIGDYEDRPFFAYVCYMDANHAIYARKFNHYFRRRAPHPEVHQAYREGIRTLDGQIGELLDELERRDLMRSTIVVVLSDHGESFGPEVRDDRSPVGHGTHLYPEQTRVPMFIVARGRLEPATVVEPASIERLPATLGALLGWTEDIDGEPLPVTDATRPTGAAEDPAERTGEAAGLPVDDAPAAWMTLRYLDRDLRAVAIPGWQYIVDGNEEGPGELVPLGPEPADDGAELGERLSRRLARHFAGRSPE